MKKQLMMKCNDENYLIEENGGCVFSISKIDLIFDTLSFYNGFFKNVDEYIVIDFKLSDALQHDNVGKYIYNWIDKIFKEIGDSINQNRTPIYEVSYKNIVISKQIKYFSQTSVCAGDGDYSLDADTTCEMIPCSNDHADFAVKIKGDSMAPKIKDNDVILIQNVQQLNHDDIGVFYYNGDLICKRFNQIDNQLEPLNSAFTSIKVTEDILIQGKYLETYSTEEN